MRKGWVLVVVAAIALATPPLTAPRAAAATIDSATLALSSPTLVPGQTVYATVTADLPANRPANNVQAHFSSDGDAVFPSGAGCNTNPSGQCSVAITAGGGYGAQHVSVDVTGIAFTASASAPLTEYDAPATMALSLSPASLQADGISATTATVTLLDGAGRGVGGELVTVSSNDAGIVIAPVADRGTGTYTAQLTAPPPNTAATGPFSDTVSAAATLSSLTKSATLTLTNPPKRLSGPLSVSGAQVLDSAGHPVVLQGADAVNFYASPADPETLTPLTAGNLYLWGANTVRVMMSSDLYLHNCSGISYPPDYVAAFDREVNLITSYGMLAVLDLHASNPQCQQPASNGQYGSASLGLPPLADAQSLFTQLTAAFASNPLVAYEVYNEPHVCLDPTTGNDVNSYGQSCTQANRDTPWLDGGTYQIVPGQTYTAAGMRALYGTVRQGAPSSLVFVDANGYAADNHSFDNVCQTSTGATCAWENPTNMVYVFHEYDCQDTTPAGQTTTQAQCNDNTPEACATITGSIGYQLQDHAHGGAAWPAPVDFNEFGWPQNEAKYQYPSTNLLGQSVQSTFTAYGHGLWINNVIATLQAHGASWSVFAYENHRPGENIWQGPYTLVADAGSVPWTANPDGQSMVNGMHGTLTCQDPPAGTG
jgi:hypothetical protein